VFLFHLLCHELNLTALKIAICAAVVGEDGN
jgi:methyl-accepting chemotaxis protein